MTRALVFLVAVVILAGCGSQSDRSSQVAAEIGEGAECTATDYAITNKIDHSKTRIYDCFRDGKEMCVTEEDGLAHDSTTVVRLLFADTLSGGKPSCIG